MRTDRLADFPIAPGLVMLNHASFGIMTRAVMALSEHTRSALEADSHGLIDPDALIPRLQLATSAAERQLGLATGSVALTQNATSGGAALMRSLSLREDEQVVVLSTEYDSIVRGWQVRCEEAGARFTRLAVPIPLTDVQQLLDALEDQVRGTVRIAQLSLVSSSTAVAFPVAAVAAWFRDRGATVLLDVAHGPGHVRLAPEAWGVDAMFGTLHKWFPTPRPVGLLWLDAHLRQLVRPAEVSLTWDATDLAARFSWPGTFDPTPRLCTELALAQWDDWKAAGDLERCEALADYASTELERIGRPSSSAEFLAPRLRAFIVAGPSRQVLRVALDAADIRAWTGNGPSGETMLRVTTHVFNEESDIDRLRQTVSALQ